MKRLVFVLLFLASALRLSADVLPVYPASRGIYVREGFERNETLIFPPVGKKWTYLTEDLDIPSIPPLSVSRILDGDRKVGEYTFLTVFHIDMNRMKGLSTGCHIPYIGENWEILLNGTRIDSYLPYHGSKLDNPAYVFPRIVELPEPLLKNGYNVLAVRIIGRKGSPYFTVGLEIPDLRIDYFGDLLQTREHQKLIETVSGTLLGALLTVLFIVFFLGLVHKDIILYIPIGLVALYYHPLFSHILLKSHTDLYSNTAPVVISAALIALCCHAIHAFRNFTARFLYSMPLVALCINVFLYYVPSHMHGRAGAVSLQVLLLAVYVYLFFDKKNLEEPPSVERKVWVKITVLIWIQLYVVLFFYTDMLTDVWMIHYGLFSVSIMLYFIIHLVQYILGLKNEKVMRITRTDALEKNRQLVQELDKLKISYAKMSQEHDSCRSRLEQSEKSLESGSNIASVVQGYIFPKNPPQCSNYDIGLYSTAADKVSGDMYDFYIEQGNLMGVSMFESTSQGLGPGLITILSRSIIYKRFTQYGDRKLSYIFNLINTDFETELLGKSIYLSGQILKCNGSIVEYVNAGHTDMIYRNGRNSSAKSVVPGDSGYKSPRLGSGDNAHHTMLSFSLNPGDMLLLYSDGYEKTGKDSYSRISTRMICDIVESIPSKLDASGVTEYLVKKYYSTIDQNQLPDDLTLIVLVKK